jgi:hypothetical protein
MSAQEDYGRPDTNPATGWVGWIMFAAIFIIVIGGINAIQGLAAIFRDEAYWVTLGGSVVAFDVTTWGWIHLIMGILLVLVGFALLQGSTIARVIAIILVAINMLAQFAWAPLYPFWAIMALFVDAMIIYALVVHGRELKPTA